MGKSTMDILVKSISCLPFILTVSGVFGSNPCDPGWYGELCDKRCSAKCLSHSDNNIYCEKHYGACSLGCVPGWYNENCIIPCSTNCIGDMCNQQTGQCTKGCKGNYRGALCDVPEVTRNDPPPRHDQEVTDGTKRAILNMVFAAGVLAVVIVLTTITVALLVRRFSSTYR
ncbi:multiple epidermal growth factor-like domains protein 11 [Haliotis rufescens]|uniref:multiple epidermal growth factor-like domains protein 11 n=1 Tax=Haliotis rufescens TaxID=6454 RepID=UPI00201EEEB7|nr:multiple epidermal growth factor-like domains protein 11 [Haliotis rufescens]